MIVMTPISRILVPIDFLPHSAEAVRHALDISNPFGAEVVLLHVYQPAEYPMAPNEVVYDAEQLERVTATVRARLEAVRRHIDPSGRRRVTARVVQGSPAQAIVEASNREAFDLIVMGTHGRTGVGRLVSGSIAEEVMRRAPCAVLTVKSPRPAQPVGRVATEPISAAPLNASRAAAFLSVFGAPGTSIARAISKSWR